MGQGQFLPSSLLLSSLCFLSSTMSQRGRGCLSIAPSDNAFYQTTTGEIGLRPNENPGSTFRRTFTETSADRTTTDGTGAGAGMDAGAATGNFAFLYTRESDKIGAMVRKSNNMQMTHTLPRKPSFGTRFMDSGLTQVPPKPSAEELLSYYRQGTKEEDPRYTTSTNEYGKKAPTLATFVAERNCRPQGFSQSFGSVKFKNSSLNTGVTRSTVHNSLDPQFG